MSAVLLRDEPAHASPSPTETAARNRLFVATLKAVVANYTAAAALLVLGFAIYAALFATVPYYHTLLTPLGFATIEVVLVAYLLLLPAFYATFPDGYDVKCRLFWRALVNLPRRMPTPDEAVALRAVAVKAFFMPLMVAWLATSSYSLVTTITTPGAISFYETVLGLMIVVDLAVFTVAYGVEHPRLGNEIRSVEPTVLGWAAALACYPPFQLASVWADGRYPIEYPNYEQPALQVAVGLLMLALMGVYTWSSVALGLKASNLTNRGTVGRGPYAVVRHPAYLSKNLFWWVAAAPVLLDWATGGGVAGVGLIVMSLLARSLLYTLRAITEERHLLHDPDYRAYCERVRWRYLPGVW